MLQRRLLTVAHNRYRWLLANRRRKVTRDDDLSTILTVLDELKHKEQGDGSDE